VGEEEKLVLCAQPLSHERTPALIKRPTSITVKGQKFTYPMSRQGEPRNKEVMIAAEILGDKETWNAAQRETVSC